MLSSPIQQGYLKLPLIHWAAPPWSFGFGAKCPFPKLSCIHMLYIKKWLKPVWEISAPSSFWLGLIFPSNYLCTPLTLQTRIFCTLNSILKCLPIVLTCPTCTTGQQWPPPPCYFLNVEGLGLFWVEPPPLTHPLDRPVQEKAWWDMNGESKHGFAFPLMDWAYAHRPRMIHCSLKCSINRDRKALPPPAVHYHHVTPPLQRLRQATWT